MFKNLLNDRGIFYAGDDLDWVFALLADLDVNMAYRDVGQGRQQEWKLRSPFLIFASRLLPWMACMAVLHRDMDVTF